MFRKLDLFLSSGNGEGRFLLHCSTCLVFKKPKMMKNEQNNNHVYDVLVYLSTEEICVEIGLNDKKTLKIMPHLECCVLAIRMVTRVNKFIPFKIAFAIFTVTGMRTENACR
jgi:hypothetical protein